MASSNSDPRFACDRSSSARISALTLATDDLEAAIRFWQRLGFTLEGVFDEGGFATLEGLRGAKLNLVRKRGYRGAWFGRPVIHVADVDSLYQALREDGFRCEAPPRDAPWGERFFHVQDPDGHEIAIARPLT